MGATTIFYNGRLISRAGSYSQVDTSGLESIGLGASGIVAVIGTAEGGKPANAMSEPHEFLTFTKPEAAREVFRSGDLREVMGLLFEPGKDTDILAGAQMVIAMKVNPATQASASFANASGDAFTATSRDYGAFTEQINIAIANGTNKGKLITVRFEDSIESKDDLGGDVMFKLQYNGGTNGYTTARAEVETNGSVKVTATKTAVGMDAEIQNQLIAPGQIKAFTGNPADTTQTLTIYGLDAGGAAQQETLTLNGVTSIFFTKTWSKFYGARLSATTLGSVVIRRVSDDAILLVNSFGGATVLAALTQLDYGYVNNTTLSIVSDGASTKNVILAGKTTSGADQVLKVTLNGTTPVVTTGVSWSKLEYIVTGDYEAARTATVTAVAARADSTIHTTLSKLAGYYNSKQVTVAGPALRGFICTLVSPSISFLLTNLDVSIATADIKAAAEASFYANLYAITDWLNTGCSFVTAAKAGGAKGGFPDNTSSPRFLAGGTEGTTQSSHYQAALNLLKKVRVNSVLVMTGDPAVHAQLEAHCAYMCGIGRSERDGFAGLLNAGLTAAPTKTELKSQIVDLNSRHIRAVAQTIDRYDSAGVRRTFLPPFTAAVAAGMQAGASVGTSLTHKYSNVLGFAQDASWNPVDDAEELIQAGLLMLENIDGVGRRWVRNVTTHLSTSNIAFTDGSVNAAVNYSVFTFRTKMEASVGKKGFSGTMNAAKGVALNTLGLLVSEQILVMYRSLAIDLILDVLEVSVEMAPVIPISFVKNTIHLVTVRQTAA